MNRERYVPMDPAERRRRAEDLLRTRPAPGTDRRFEGDGPGLAHEARVRELEFELLEDELRRAVARTDSVEEELAEIRELAPTCLLTLDREGSIRWTNRAAAELLALDGTGPDAHLSTFADAPSRGRLAECLRRVFADGGRSECELTLAPAGRPAAVVRLEAVARKRRDECVAVLVDVTAHRSIEERLRASEAHLNLAVASGNVGIWEWRADTNEVRLNDRLLGYLKPPPEGAPMTLAWVLDAMHPDDRGAAEAALRAAFESRAPLEHEFRAVLPDGTVRTMTVSARAVDDEAGRPIGMIGAAIDVTELRTSYEALRESERRYHLLFDASPQVMWVVDAETLRFLAVNDAMVRHYGWSREELLGMTLADIRPPEEWPGLRDRIRGYVASGRFEPRVRRHRRRDGTDILMEVLGNVVALGGRKAVLVLAVDVTERERAQESVQTLSRAVEQSPTAIVVTDARGAIEYVNPRFTKVTGYPAAEAIGRTPRILKSELTSPEVHRELWRTIASGGTWQGTLQNRRKDGTTYWANASISPVVDAEGRITHYVGAQEDVTARRLLEDELRQAQKMEAVGQLAGGVAHDFNNELTVITGYSELARLRTTEGDTRRAWLEQVTRAAARAASLTQRLLAFSRRQVLRPTVLQMNDVVRGMEKMLGRLVREDVVVRAQLGEGLEPVLADAGQVEQALMNLCSNSRDAMPDGGTITLATSMFPLDAAFARTHPGARPGRYVCLEVADTGVGMTDEIRARVFEPFFTTKPPGQGTGLGLAMVYGFVKQSGGYVECVSSPGNGATFRLLLPAVEATPTAPPSPAPAVRAAGDETVLVVDDEPAVAAIATDALAEAGYTVLTAESPEAALRCCETHEGPIHLLVTDVVMPGMNGPKVASLVRAARPGTPVLYVSGYTADLVATGGVLDPEIAFLAKPFTPVELCARVRTVLDAARADAAALDAERRRRGPDAR